MAFNQYSAQKLFNYQTLPIPAVALRSLLSKKGDAIYASNDTLYKGAVFGRDSIEVAEDLIRLRPKLVQRIIFTLACLQGEEMNDLNEEEPGKIIHEYREAEVDGKPLEGISKHIFSELSKRWGGTDDYLAYYGSIDSTPHFVRLVDRYCRLHGDKILKQKIMLRSGHQITIAIILENCMHFILNQLEQSKSGLLEYKKRNPKSIDNQVWKDSKEFYMHKNGQPANHNAPIASIEVQGLAYDALIGAASLIPNNAEQYTELAQSLRDKTIELLWDERSKYFHLGIDFDESGKLRKLDISTANPAALLDTNMFKDLDIASKQKFIKSIVAMIMSRDFLTDAGIRSRALSEHNLVAYWDYHGSYVSWPKETYDIAKGLRRQGFPLLARELENRIINTIRISRSYVEFVYVDGWGRVLSGAPSATEHGDVIILDGASKPQAIHAWTVSAVMAIIAYKLAKRMKQTLPIKQEKWQSELEQSILRSIPRTPLYFDKRTLQARYPSYPYRLVRANSLASTDLPGR